MVLARWKLKLLCGYPFLIIRVTATMSCPGVALSAIQGGGQTLFRTPDSAE